MMYFWETSMAENTILGSAAMFLGQLFVITNCSSEAKEQQILQIVALKKNHKTWNNFSAIFKHSAPNYPQHTFRPFCGTAVSHYSSEEMWSILAFFPLNKNVHFGPSSCKNTSHSKGSASRKKLCAHFRRRKCHFFP